MKKVITLPVLYLDSLKQMVWHLLQTHTDKAKRKQFLVKMDLQALLDLKRKITWLKSSLLQVVTNFQMKLSKFL